FRHRLPVHFRLYKAVSQGIADAHPLDRQLPFLADRNEASRHLMRDSPAENEAARLDAGDLVDLHPGPWLHQLVHRTAEGPRIAQQRGDVAEHDARLRVIRNRADGLAQVVLDSTRRHRVAPPPGSHRRGDSRLSSYAASNTGAASVDSICKTALPALEKPCFRPAGTITNWPFVRVTCSSSIQTSAVPSRTHSTSSTAWRCVGAPWPGSHHCSNRQSCVALLAADAFIRVLTPERHASLDCWCRSTMRIGPLVRVAAVWPTISVGTIGETISVP